jgi:LysR family glycine cleavage system transcriptional activator
MLRLPPLNALRAFEAAARHSSFARAADELCVTPGAVSRHILKLEAYLGTKLFTRGHAQVQLTPSGQDYLLEVREAFVRISQATTTTRTTGLNERLLRIKVPPTCAARWLVPRLAHFHAEHPEISIQLTTSHDAIDFGRDDVDAAVQYGRNTGTEFAAQRLFDEVLLPVCSAAVAAQTPALRRPRDVARHVLLHSIRRPNDWADWFAGAGVDDPPLDKSMAFENSTLTYQGAVDGLGVAIAQVAFVLDEIDRGRLVAPVDVRLKSEQAYFLVFPREKAPLRKLRLFSEWAATEAATTRAAMA